jgi:hypothetical protein
MQPPFMIPLEMANLKGSPTKISNYSMNYC